MRNSREKCLILCLDISIHAADRDFSGLNRFYAAIRALHDERAIFIQVNGFSVGDRIALYNTDGLPQGDAELTVSLQNLRFFCKKNSIHPVQRRDHGCSQPGRGDGVAGCYGQGCSNI